MSSASFVYEVNLKVQAQHASAFATWLKPHIEEMLGFEGFVDAHWYSRKASEEASQDTEGDISDEVLWTVHYHLRDKAAFELYLRTHADRMRADGLKRFAGCFSATRRLLYAYEEGDQTKNSQSTD